MSEQKEPNQMNAESIAKIVHALRTPIVAIQHSLALLKDEVVGPLSEEQQKFLGVASRNLERISGLVDQLLDSKK